MPSGSAVMGLQSRRPFFAAPSEGAVGARAEVWSGELLARSQEPVLRRARVGATKRPSPARYKGSRFPWHTPNAAWATAEGSPCPAQSCGQAARRGSGLARRPRWMCGGRSGGCAGRPRVGAEHPLGDACLDSALDVPLKAQGWPVAGGPRAAHGSRDVVQPLLSSSIHIGQALDCVLKYPAVAGYFKLDLCRPLAVIPRMNSEPPAQ